MRQREKGRSPGVGHPAIWPSAGVRSQTWWRECAAQKIRATMRVLQSAQSFLPLEIVVSKETAVVVGFQPVIKMNLIEI